MARHASAGLALALLVLPALLPTGDADAYVGLASLPAPRYDAAAAWNGTHALVVGGLRSATLGHADVLAYDPSAGATVLATLPTDRHGAAAFYDGASLYVLGGKTVSGTFLASILRVDPATGTVTTLPEQLPSGRSHMSVVWDGTHAWIFGGTNGTHNDIVRYDPALATVTTLAAKLGPGRYGGSVVFDGRYAFLFGGWSGIGTNATDTVARFDTHTSTVVNMGAKLPAGWIGTYATYDGRYAHVHGGSRFASGTSTRYLTTARYDPLADTFQLMDALLPSARDRGAAVWTPGGPLLVGGVDAAPTASVVRYDLTPAAPRNLVATAGPGAGQITVTWTAPPSTSYSSPITGYRVHVGGSPGTEIYAATVGGTTFTESGLTNGQARSYRVSAVNAMGEGALSSSAVGRAAVPPGAPEDLRAIPSLATPGGVTLLWSPPDSSGGIPVTAYRIYKGLASGGETFLAEVGAVTTYEDAGCSVGTFCWYQVSAVNGAGEGPRSAEALAAGMRVP